MTKNLSFKVIEDLQEELHLRKQLEDLDNHNHAMVDSTSILEMSKDISTLTEDCFLGGNTGKSRFILTFSTYFPIAFCILSSNAN